MMWFPSLVTKKLEDARSSMSAGGEDLNKYLKLFESIKPFYLREG